MFEGWHEYYLTIGAAAGALIGLLFVVVTLTADFERARALKAVGIYMTPTALYFTTTLALSGLALAPRLSPTTVGLLVGLAAAVGLINAVRACIGIRGLANSESTPPHWSDFWLYGAAPTALYLALAGVAFAIATERDGGDHGLAAVLMALMLLGIRNAWDLITWMAPRSAEKKATTAGRKKAS